MNNYIIDPAVFYWMNVLSAVRIVMIVIASFALIGFSCLIVTYIWRRSNLNRPEDPEEGNEYDKRLYRRYMKEYVQEKEHIEVIRKWMIATAVIGVIFGIIAIFSPSKQTSVEMLVARTATFDNVNWTVQQVKEIVDYIVNALKGAV